MSVDVRILTLENAGDIVKQIRALLEDKEVQIDSEGRKENTRVLTQPQYPAVEVHEEAGRRCIRINTLRGIYTYRIPMHGEPLTVILFEKGQVTVQRSTARNTYITTYAVVS